MKPIERLTNSFPLKRMNIIVYTFETKRTRFLESICAMKSSIENLSLRVSGHVSGMNRTFIVEDYAEDDFGQRAIDEVTGEQGCVDDERSCFWTWDDTEGVWQSKPYKGRQLNRKRKKEKEKKKEKGKRKKEKGKRKKEKGKRKKEKGKRNRKAQGFLHRKRKNIPWRRTSTRF